MEPKPTGRVARPPDPPPPLSGLPEQLFQARVHCDCLTLETTSGPDGAVTLRARAANICRPSLDQSGKFTLVVDGEQVAATRLDAADHAQLVVKFTAREPACGHDVRLVLEGSQSKVYLGQQLAREPLHAEHSFRVRY